MSTYLTTESVEQLVGMTTAESDAYLANVAATPAALPDWLLTDRAPMTVLDAVMHHPAEEIAGALEVLDELDLQVLLEDLARPAATKTGAR